MARNVHFKKEVDCYKSLNKIMLLGLSGMTVLGASIIISEGSKANASLLYKGANSSSRILSTGSKIVLRSPAFRPEKVYTPTISLLNKTGVLTKNTPITQGALLSSIKRSQLNKPVLSPIKPMAPTNQTHSLTSRPTLNPKPILTPKPNVTPITTPTLTKKN